MDEMMGGAEADTNTEDEGKEATVKTETAPAAAVVVTSNEDTAAVAPPAALNGADLLSKDMKVRETKYFFVKISNIFS